MWTLLTSTEHEDTIHDDIKKGKPPEDKQLATLAKSS
jgi:hypothetical protein